MIKSLLALVFCLYYYYPVISLQQEKHPKKVYSSKQTGKQNKNQTKRVLDKKVHTEKKLK